MQHSAMLLSNIPTVPPSKRRQHWVPTNGMTHQAIHQLPDRTCMSSLKMTACSSVLPAAATNLSKSVFSSPTLSVFSMEGSESQHAIKMCYAGQWLAMFVQWWSSAERGFAAGHTLVNPSVTKSFPFHPGSEDEDNEGAAGQPVATHVFQHFCKLASLHAFDLALPSICSPGLVRLLVNACCLENAVRQLALQQVIVAALPGVQLRTPSNVAAVASLRQTTHPWQGVSNAWNIAA
jgi:hypothetical protein